MIVLGSDHVGYTLKTIVMEYFDKNGIAYIDAGFNENEKGDYPVAGLRAAKMIISGKAEKGILFCGTGIGISIAANKEKGIRCAVCSEPYSSRLSKEHNDSNMLALGARVVGSELALDIVRAWLDAEFEGGRHAKRVDQISDIENGLDLE